MQQMITCVLGTVFTGELKDTLEKHLRDLVLRRSGFLQEWQAQL